MSKYDGLTRQSTIEDRRVVYRSKLNDVMNKIEKEAANFSGAMIEFHMNKIVKYGRIIERDERYDRNFNTLLCMAISAGRLSHFYSPFAASSNFSKKYHPKELPFNIYPDFNSYLIDLPSIRVRDSFAHYESVMNNIAFFVRLLQMYDFMEDFDMTPALMIMEAVIRDANDPFIIIPWFAITRNTTPEIDAKIMEVVLKYLDYTTLMDTDKRDNFIEYNNYHNLHRYFKNKDDMVVRLFGNLPAECQLGILI